MAYEQKDNSGSLFRNDKQGVETRPDRTGSALIDGVEYWVSGWLKEGKSGQFLSLAFKRKDDARGKQHKGGTTVEERQAPKGRDGGMGSMKDDIPW